MVYLASSKAHCLYFEAQIHNSLSIFPAYLCLCACMCLSTDEGLGMDSCIMHEQYISCCLCLPMMQQTSSLFTFIFAVDEDISSRLLRLKTSWTNSCYDILCSVAASYSIWAQASSSWGYSCCHSERGQLCFTAWWGTESQTVIINSSFLCDCSVGPDHIFLILTVKFGS